MGTAGARSEGIMQYTASSLCLCTSMANVFAAPSSFRRVCLDRHSASTEQSDRSRPCDALEGSWWVRDALLCCIHPHGVSWTRYAAGNFILADFEVVRSNLGNFGHFWTLFDHVRAKSRPNSKSSKRGQKSRRKPGSQTRTPGLVLRDSFVTN